MQPASSIEDLRTNPIGRYLAGETFLFFCPDEKLAGFVAWGTVHEEDMRRLAMALGAHFGPRPVPHVSMIDTRRVDHLEHGGFRVLNEYVKANYDFMRQYILRAAVIRSRTVVGATAAGFYEMFSPKPYPVEVFEDPADGLEWLGVGRRPEFLLELDDLCARVRGTTPFLRSLRDLLDAGPAEMALPSAARALGMSERTLQRRLKDEATTFQSEYCSAQIRVAQRLMMQSDIKLTSLAFEVGCASPQHFSALFKREVGITPSQWRSAQRRR